eukprot:jgi/Chrzof1/13278/Cz07g27090.t1
MHVTRLACVLVFGLLAIGNAAADSSFATEAGLDGTSRGLRQFTCRCTKEYSPVCGQDGVTYNNTCLAICEYTSVVHSGPCVSSQSSSKPGKDDCICAAIYKPVCGKDGVSYPSACVAGCKKVAVQYDGECKKASGAKASCLCTMDWKPVCGKNNVTYTNSCVARCENVTVARTGQCSKPAQGPVPSKTAQELATASSSGAPSSPRPAAKPSRVAAPCMCSNQTSPVCGLDGKSYSSQCYMRCANTYQAYPGPCKPECAACPKKVFPYCINHQSYGVRTFANCCFARCNGVVGDKDILYPGACKFTAACAACNAKQFAPVCCSNGKSYKNSCFATCNGASQCRPGHCSAGLDGVSTGLGCLMGPCPIRCDPNYQDPVCVHTGLTYPNKCVVLCDTSLAIVREGRCGKCANGQRNGTFPYCSPKDTVGLKPVCGSNNVTYRNAGAAVVARLQVVSQGACANKCGETGEVCFQPGSQSSCCSQHLCIASTTVNSTIPGQCQPAPAKESNQP